MMRTEPEAITAEEQEMPRTSEREIDPQDYGPVVTHETELADIAVSVTTMKEEVDMAPILAGLPTGSCQCPHWGVLRKGRATVRYDDGREEVIEAGDIFYMTPGHVPVFAAGSEVVMFSPAAELTATNEAIEKFMASQQPPASTTQGR